MGKRATPKIVKKPKGIRSPSVKGKPRPDSCAIPSGVQKHLDDLAPFLRDNIPESTACAMIGLEFRVWEEYTARYPALKVAAKRIQAERLIEWQRTVEAGAQGWQAAAVLLERRDPLNWSRTAVGRPTQSKSPYTAAMGRRKAK